jgi:hypothetical protein
MVAIQDKLIESKTLYDNLRDEGMLFFLGRQVMKHSLESKPSG